MGNMWFLSLSESTRITLRQDVSHFKDHLQIKERSPMRSLFNVNNTGHIRFLIVLLEAKVIPNWLEVIFLGSDMITSVLSEFRRRKLQDFQVFMSN